MDKQKFVAFKNCDGDCMGFTSLKNFLGKESLFINLEEGEEPVHFTGPVYDPRGLTTEEVDKQFEHLKWLAAAAVAKSRL